MSKEVKILIARILFFAVCLLDVYTVLASDYSLRRYTKMLPLFFLALLYVVSVSNINWWIVTALLLYSIGDYLIFDKEKVRFSFGVFLFSIAHIICTKQIFKYVQKLPKIKFLYNIIIFLSFFAVVFLFVLKDNLGITFYPILFYGFTICVFAAVSFMMYLNNMKKANFFLFIGVFINLASDGIFTINAFGKIDVLLNTLVIITYLTGHYLVCKGFILKQKESALKV